VQDTLTTLLFQIIDIPLDDLKRFRDARIESVRQLPHDTPDQRYTVQIGKLHVSILDDLIQVHQKYDRMGYIMARHRVDVTFDGANPTFSNSTIPF
jgi:hypothetical protein